jgi:inner membrane protein involved in colicin E2 resistance
METPPLVAAATLPPPPVERNKIDRRNAVTLKVLFIAGLVLLLQAPLHLLNSLRQERSENYDRAFNAKAAAATQPAGKANTAEVQAIEVNRKKFDDAYRMVERSLKHGVLILALVFTAFFLFEIVAGLRVHVVHYSLIGAALCLFYMALLALGEVASPGYAYLAAAGASSLLIVFYSAAVLRAWARAGLIAGLLAVVHSVLFIVLRMEDFALLAGTAALFAALAAVMFFTRNVDWYAQDTGERSGASSVPVKL